VPIIISQKQPGLQLIFESIAGERKSPIIFASDVYQIEQATPERFNVIKNEEIYLEGVLPDLKGAYQSLNVSGVLACIEHLAYFNISEANIKSGLQKVTENTGLKGRWQLLRNSPITICDTGHNVDGVKMIVNQLSQYDYKQLHIVWGMVEDKSVEAVLKLLPIDAVYYFCAANIPRALNVTLLANEASKFELVGIAFGSVSEAIGTAKKNAETNDLIFIGGSTFVVAEIDEL